jgi:hypothetical protein
VINLATSIEPDQPARVSGLTRLFTVGSLYFDHEIPEKPENIGEYKILTFHS